ncbi:MAG: DUF4129 domain-containing protein [Planctomycetaceae bacterium]
MIRFLLFILLTLLTVQKNASAAIALPLAIQEGSLLTDDAIDQVGEQVMGGDEFRSVRRRVLEQLPEVDIDKGFLGSALEWAGERLGDVFSAIGNFFEWLFSGLRSPRGTTRPPPAQNSTGSGFGFLGITDLLTTLAIIAIIAILIVIIAMVVKSIDAKKQKRESLLSDLSDVLSDVVTPPGDLAASTYESRAISLAAGGDHRAAIRELLLGSMSWIERAGLIRYRKGLTNRDYLRCVWRRQDKRNAFLTTATQFEYVFFGRRNPTAEMFEQCLASFRGAFHEEETPTAAV